MLFRIDLVKSTPRHNAPCVNTRGMARDLSALGGGRIHPAFLLLSVLLCTEALAQWRTNQVYTIPSIDNHLNSLIEAEPVADSPPRR